ncbi:MAG: alginate export family protein [Sphingobacteriales bacterium]|nr:alginate export family protein [Sphingobacteriales bacterium]
MKLLPSAIILLLIILIINNNVYAQLSLSAQLRTRTELRDGLGAPAAKNADPAFFTGQRTRLRLGYSTYRLKLAVSLQDVRVWGQDVSTVNRTTTQDNNGLMLHEAWAEIGITDTTQKHYALSVKLGRQELSYDDQRLIGNLDWPLQARRHDAAVLQFNTTGGMIHAGFAYNQNKESAAGTKYIQNPAGNYAANTNGSSTYKSFEYLYAQRKYAGGNTSFLFFADQFNKYHTGIENNIPVKIWDNGAWQRFTTGMYSSHTLGKAQVTAEAYYQFGKTPAGQKLSAALLSLNAMIATSDHFSVGPGIDFTTGGNSGNTTRAFDPLYGTPHKFWGLMDYFYAGSTFGNKGLADIYIKSKYKATGKLQLSAELHHFSSASAVKDIDGAALSRQFGMEADLVAGYSLTSIISLEAGYSHYFSTATLSSVEVKHVDNAQKNNNWAYLMVRIQPEIFFK